MTVVACEQLPLPVLPAEWFVERVPSDRWLNRRMGEWAGLRAEGWQVTVLLAPDKQSLVAIGMRP